MHVHYYLACLFKPAFISTGEDDYSFTDLQMFFTGDQVEIEFSIATDSIALEGNERFSISVTLVETFLPALPAANEFVADPLIVTIQDLNGTQCLNSDYI